MAGAHDVATPPGGGHASAIGGRRRPRTLLAAACAAGIAVGSLLTYAVTRAGSATEPAPARVAAAELTPLGSQTLIGEADLIDSGSQVELSVRTEPLDPGSGYLEVWLINKDLKRMVSIGVMPPGARTTVLPVTRQLIDQGYVIVDISREAYDDKPAHSGNTLARGALNS